MAVTSDLADLLHTRDFRRLFTVRMVSQAGDGMFQVGLAALFFFSPESQGTAASIALAFAILLAPFTIVGPWAGVLLDRWRRRQVLVVANSVRVVLTVMIAAVIATSGIGLAVYVLALLNLSLNRFLLATLGAALPHTVTGDHLLTANALVPTLGAGAAGIGGALGLLLGLAVPEGTTRDAASLGVAALFFLAASLTASGFPADRLGPDERTHTETLRTELGRLGHGLIEGAGYLIRRRTPGQALAVMGVHRFLYGVTFVASILISRNLVEESGPAGGGDGLGVFATVLAATAVGFGGAVLLTPFAAVRTGPQRWIVICLVLACGSQAVLALTLTHATMLGCAVILGLASQGAKIAVDTIVQQDTADAFRGRAFALYDTIYNSAFIAAAAFAAVTLPDNGFSAPVFWALAGGYGIIAVIFSRWGARTPRPVER